MIKESSKRGSYQRGSREDAGKRRSKGTRKQVSREGCEPERETVRERSREETRDQGGR